MGTWQFPGWHLLGSFESDVGSWLLVNDGEALLLEIPEGLTVKKIQKTLRATQTKLRYVIASHDHWDHIDHSVWKSLTKTFPDAKFIHPAIVHKDLYLSLGNESLWLIKAPKHSLVDVVTVFRGVAMTGDIELATIDSITDEVPYYVRKRSMDWLQGFQDRHNYKIHTIVSAHLDDIRIGVNWQELFTCEEYHVC